MVMSSTLGVHQHETATAAPAAAGLEAAPSAASLFFVRRHYQSCRHGKSLIRQEESAPTTATDSLAVAERNPATAWLPECRSPWRWWRRIGMLVMRA